MVLFNQQQLLTVEQITLTFQQYPLHHLIEQPLPRLSLETIRYIIVVIMMLMVLTLNLHRM